MPDMAGDNPTGGAKTPGRARRSKEYLGELRAKKLRAKKGAASGEKGFLDQDPTELLRKVPGSLKGAGLLMVANLLQGATGGVPDSIQKARGEFGLGSEGWGGPLREEEEGELTTAMGMGQFAQDQMARRKRAIDEQNMQMLMSQQPQLAAQLLAGRSLPQDAVVIGGRQRTDLLQEVAGRMTAGQFQPPPGPIESMMGGGSR